MQFVFPGILSKVRNGKAVVGKSGRAVLLIESDIVDGQLGVYTVDADREDPDKVFCDDIVPHELLHVLDVRQGRSPSLYPWTVPGQGEWLDLFRHMWIDGHLEELGLPHLPKAERIRELAEYVGREKAEMLALTWWGRPMTMRDAVRLGLEAGLALEPDCPIAVWYRNS